MLLGGDGGHRLGGEGGGEGGGVHYDSVGLGVDFDFSPARSRPLAAGVCALIVAIGAGALAVFCLGTVPPLHYGIKYNQYTKASDTEVIHRPGRYFIGPFSTFLLFPSDVQTIEFVQEPRIGPAGVRYAALHTRTKEGLGLHLQVSLQYRLIEQYIGNLYSEFNQNYEQVFSSSVRDILIKAASEYEASDLWEERKKFGDTMQSMVDAELKKTFADCWGLQLIFIELPDEYEGSIVRSEVQKQNLFMKEQEQLSTQIRSQTDVIRAEYDRKVKVLMAAGHANYTLITKGAQAEAQQNKINVESEVFASLKENLNLAAPDLVKYSKYGAVGELEDAALFYGFEGRTQMLLQGNSPVSPPPPPAGR